jgi:hypothetical protein
MELLLLCELKLLEPDGGARGITLGVQGGGLGLGGGRMAGAHSLRLGGQGGPSVKGR